MTQRLVEVEAKPRWTGSRALVRTTVSRFCGPCGFDGGAAVSETNPRRLA